MREEPEGGARSLLACPRCFSSLERHAVHYQCHRCSHNFPLVDGIPIMTAGPVNAGHDGHDHEVHKAAQAAYYDGERASEFEILRPNNAPGLYEWLMREKFRRSMCSLGALSAGSDHRFALTVCGGSGMEAQFLAERGFDVIASDLSLGAARRCQERARRLGLRILSIVADVERLPFASRSVPLVYVHDGLHHLENPLAGVAEMARVARDAVSITEPARAALTRVAIRLGLADAVEAPGNRIARLDADRVESVLDDLGFGALESHRYAMYYRHRPGRLMELLSHPRLMPLVQVAIRAADLAVGRWGNKLAVSGFRRSNAMQKEY